MTNKLTAESQKCDLLDHDMKTLKAENVDLNGILRKVLSQLDTAKASFNRMNVGSRKLDDILSSQKANTDKYGIRYIYSSTTSNAKGKNYLVQKFSRY